MAVEDRAATVAGLRAWAKGAYAEEAAVELLVRAFAGRFASVSWPWVRLSGRQGWFWLDPEAIWTGSGCLSGGEQRVLGIVAALCGGQPVPDLGASLAGIDREQLRLVLAAFAHAGGSHEHSELTLTPDGPVFDHLGPLLAWPAPDRASVEVA